MIKGTLKRFIIKCNYTFHSSVVKPYLCFYVLSLCTSSPLLFVVQITLNTLLPLIWRRKLEKKGEACFMIIRVCNSGDCFFHQRWIIAHKYFRKFLLNRIIFLFYNTWLQTYTEKFIKLQVLSFNSLRINSKSTVMLPYIIVLSLMSVDPMNILWVSADKRAAMRTTSYPVYRTSILINLVSLHRTVNIILTIMNGKTTQ